MDLERLLSLPAWSALSDAEAAAAMRAIEARVSRAKFLGFEPAQKGGRVALFEVGGVVMCLVPGARVTLGFDPSLLDATATQAWSRSFQNEGHAAQQIVGGPDVGRASPADMVAYIRGETSPVREVTLLPFLAEREPGPDRDALLEDADADPHDAMAIAVASQGFRLLTSDEWEHASSADSRTLFRWGDTWPVDTDVYAGGAFEGHRAPNAFGLSFGTDPYHSEIVDDPSELRGGDGGCLVCGESGPIAWITFASAYRYHLKVSDGRDVWFEQTHARRALSLFPQQGDGEIRRYVAPTVLDDEKLAEHVLQGALQPLGGELVLEEQARPAFREKVGDLAAIAAAHPNAAGVRALLSHAHRKLDELDLARTRALEAIALERNWRGHVTLAAAERARGDVAAALRAFDAAAELGPSDTSALTDAAQLLQAAKRYGEAATWWKRALDRDAHLGFARVNALVCRFHATGDAEASRELVELARGPAAGVDWIAELTDEVSPGWRSS